MVAGVTNSGSSSAAPVPGQNINLNNVARVAASLSAPQSNQNNFISPYAGGGGGSGPAQPVPTAPSAPATANDIVAGRGSLASNVIGASPGLGLSQSPFATGGGFNPAAATAAGYQVLNNSQAPGGYVLVSGGGVYDINGNYLYSSNSNIPTNTKNGVSAPASLANYTPPPGPPANTGNNITYTAFGTATAPTIAFSTINPNQFTGSYNLNGYNVQYGGTLPESYINEPEQQRINAAVDYAYQAINNLQVPNLPAGATKVQPIQIDLDNFGVPGEQAVSGGSYQLPGQAPPVNPAGLQYGAKLVSGQIGSSSISNTNRLEESQLPLTVEQIQGKQVVEGPEAVQQLTLPTNQQQPNSPIPIISYNTAPPIYGSSGQIYMPFLNVNGRPFNLQAATQDIQTAIDKYLQYHSANNPASAAGKSNEAISQAASVLNPAISFTANSPILKGFSPELTFAQAATTSAAQTLNPLNWPSSLALIFNADIVGKQITSIPQQFEQAPAKTAGSLAGQLIAGYVLGRVGGTVAENAGPRVESFAPSEGASSTGLVFKAGSKDIPLISTTVGSGGRSFSLGTPAFDNAADLATEAGTNANNVNKITSDFANRVVQATLDKGVQAGTVDGNLATLYKNTLNLVKESQGLAKDIPQPIDLHLNLDAERYSPAAQAEIENILHDYGSQYQVYGTASVSINLADLISKYGQEIFRGAHDVDLQQLQFSSTAPDQVAQDIAARLTRATGQQYTVDPNEPNLVVAREGFNVFDIHPVGEAGSTDVLPNKMFGIRQAAPITIDGVKVSPIQNTLLGKAFSSLTPRLTEEGELTISPAEYRAKDISDLYAIQTRVLQAVGFPPDAAITEANRAISLGLMTEADFQAALANPISAQIATEALAAQDYIAPVSSAAVNLVSPSSSPIISGSPSLYAPPSISQYASQSNSPSASGYPSISFSPSGSASPSGSPSAPGSISPSIVPSPSISPSFSPSHSESPSISPSPSGSPSGSSSYTPPPPTKKQLPLPIPLTLAQLAKLRKQIAERTNAVQFGVYRPELNLFGTENGPLETRSLLGIGNRPAIGALTPADVETLANQGILVPGRSAFNQRTGRVELLAVA